MFEIKSSTQGQLAEGIADVAKNIAGLNRGMPPKPFTHGTGFAGDVWVRFDLSMRWWRLDWSTTAPGVIQYNWHKLNDDEVDEDTIRKGLAAGRFKWVDLTQADMEQYAEKCVEFSRMYAVGAEKIYKLEMITDFVVKLIGDVTMVYLSPGLGLAKTAETAASPVRRVGSTVTTSSPAGPGPVKASKTNMAPTWVTSAPSSSSQTSAHPH